VVFNVVGVRILRIALAVPVIVNYQISRQPHQPVRQIALFGVVLIERAVNADENFLRQIFRRFDARRKTIGEIENPPRKGETISSQAAPSPARQRRTSSAPLLVRHRCF
jgi:hypothetical protein